VLTLRVVLLLLLLVLLGQVTGQVPDGYLFSLALMILTPRLQKRTFFATHLPDK
jgi:hypothetical protein